VARVPVRTLYVTGAERILHIQDSQGQILALAFRDKSCKPFYAVPVSLGIGWSFI